MQIDETHIAGLEAGVVRGGEGPPLLLLHGIMSRWQHFTNYLEWFGGQGFSCYAISYRGRGGVPPAGASGLSFYDYLDDAMRATEALGGEVIAIGHSLGALIAQKLLEARRARAAVLLAPAPPGHVRLPPVSATRLFVEAFPAAVSGRASILSYEALSKVTMPLVPEEKRRAIYSSFVLESGKVLRELALGIPVGPIRPPAPVLCVSGQRDGICPPRLAANVAARYTARYLCYANHDHWLLDEPGWELPAQAISDWIKQEQ